MRDYFRYLAYRGFTFFVTLLPRRAAVWVGRRLGGLFVLLDKRSRHVGMENLRRALPERTDHRRILQNAMRSQGVALMDSVWGRRWSDELARKVVEIGPKERELTQRLIGEGRGIVVATGHYGSWEMLNLAGSSIGFPRGLFLARPVPNERIDKHLRERRERGGNRLVYRKGALVACMHALKRGEAVCSVIDIAVQAQEGGIFVDFFGTPALTATALPALALKRRAPFIVLLCKPVDKNRRYVIECEQVELDYDAEDQEAERHAATQRMTHIFERHIRANPEAWLWGYKRWKWRPSESPEGYPSYSMWVHPLW